MDTPTPSSKFSFEQRWSPALKRHGHTPVSNYFLKNYARLHPYSLTYGEAMFVIHLMQHKWSAAAPFPSYGKLAERMGVSVKSARRLAASLHHKKYLRREFRTGETNLFHLGGLMTALEAQIAIDARPAVETPTLTRRRRS